MKTYATFKRPVIRITLDAKNKMDALIHQSKDEIGWHGFVKHDKDSNIYTVYDIIVYPQVVTATSILPDQEKFTKWLDKYRLDMTCPFEELRLHGHSHVNMAVFSSAVDTKFQQDLMTNTRPGDYYMFLIMNKKNEVYPIIYDRAHEVILEDKDITIEYIGNLANNAWATAQIKEYIEKPKVNPYSYYNRTVINQTATKTQIKIAKQAQEAHIRQLNAEAIAEYSNDSLLMDEYYTDYME